MKKSIIMCALAAVLAGTLLCTACSREDSGVGDAGIGTAAGEQHTAVETELTHDSTAADAPRLTVEALNEIISQSADENELWKKIMDQYGSSDQWMSFSGVAGFETRYWLNDDGSKYISYLYHFNRSKTTICYGENVTVLYSNESCNHTPFEVEQ